MIWKLYENRYVIEICNNEKKYKSDNRIVFFEMLDLLLVCYA